MNNVLILGFILGIAGAILDFYSSFFFLSDATSRTVMMGITSVHYNSTAEAWGISFAILGLLLLITAIASVSSFGMGRMSLFGAMMIVFGLVMISLGFLMYSGYTPMMSQQGATTFSSFGMFVVGFLMLLNGSVMIVRRMPTTSISPKNM